MTQRFTKPTSYIFSIVLLLIGTSTVSAAGIVEEQKLIPQAIYSALIKTCLPNSTGMLPFDSAHKEQLAAADTILIDAKNNQDVQRLLQFSDDVAGVSTLAPNYVVMASIPSASMCRIGLINMPPEGAWLLAKDEILAKGAPWKLVKQLEVKGINMEQYEWDRTVIPLDRPITLNISGPTKTVNNNTSGLQLMISVGQTKE